MIKRILSRLFARKAEKGEIRIDVRPFLTLIEATRMLAENERCELSGESLAYGEEDFLKLMDKYGIKEEK